MLLLIPIKTRNWKEIRKKIIKIRNIKEEIIKKITRNKP